MDEGGESLGDIYYRWFHIDSGTYSIRYPDPIRTENTEAVRKVLKEEKDPPSARVLLQVRTSPSATVSDPLVSPPPISHSPHILGAPVPSVYLSPSLSSSGTAMPELILPSTAMTTTDVTTTSTSAHSLPADKFSSDLNEIITEPLLNQEGFNEIMGDLNTMLQVNAGDLHQVIAVPPAHQEADYNMIGEGEQLLGSEALVAPLPVMDEPLDDDENAMVDDIDEDDEQVSDNEVIVPNKSISPSSFTTHFRSTSAVSILESKYFI